MKKARTNFHWFTLLAAVVGWGLLIALNHADLRSIFLSISSWAYTIGFWAWVVAGFWFAWKQLLGDLEPIIERFRPMEEENETLVRQVMPDGTVYNGEMGQLYHHLKHFRASEGKGSQAYWKEILRLYPDQKRIKGHALNQLKYFKPKAPTPVAKTA